MFYLTKMPISKEKIFYIEEALKEAKKSPLRCKHGCIIVKDGEIISRGFNNFRGYNKYGTCFINHRYSTHAEQAAIDNCTNRNNMKDADLYVVRLDVKKYGTSYSAPCHKCSKLIKSCKKKYGLRKIYFSTEITL